MTALVYGEDAAVVAYVSGITGKRFGLYDRAIGVAGRRGLIGGFVFTNWTGPSIEMSLAGRGVISRSAWAAVADYVFGQCGCSRLAIHTERGNTRVRAIAPKLGFRFEGVARRMYGGQDGLTYALTADDMPAFRERWRI